MPLVGVGEAVFLAHVRSAAAGHAADGGFGHHYGTFVNAADNFRVDSVGDTYLHRMVGNVTFSRTGCLSTA